MAPSLHVIIVDIIITREVNCRHVLIAHLSKDCVWVEVSHSHLAAAEVSRSTINTVARLVGCDTDARLDDRRWVFLMRTSRHLSVVQPLSEEDIVIRPDGVITVIFETDVIVLWNGSSSIDEVTISKAILHVLPSIITRRTEFCIIIILTIILQRQDRITIRINIINEVAKWCRRTTMCDMIVIALPEIETVQVVSHLTIEEGLSRHPGRDAIRSCVVSVFVCCIVLLLIIAVHDTVKTVTIPSCRIVEYRLRGLCSCTAIIYPAVLHITTTCFGNTSISNVIAR